jgi:endoglucanase
MIPPYAASSDPKTWSKFIVPKDDKVIVSIHAYVPYNFALNKTGGSSWNKDNSEDTIQIDNMMNNIDNSFVRKGVPVIIGEFGAVNKNNINERIAWSEYYVKKAKEKGIVCIWWDNGAFNGQGDNLGLLNRIRHIWKYPEIINALMKGLN